MCHCVCFSGCYLFPGDFAIASLAAAITYGGGGVGEEVSVILLLNIKHLFLTKPVAFQQQYIPLICK